MPNKVLLRNVAYSRAGDKGNRSTLSVIAYNIKDFPAIERLVTAERVKQHYAGIAKGDVDRYVLPQLGALNFVLHDALVTSEMLELCPQAQKILVGYFTSTPRDTR